MLNDILTLDQQWPSTDQTFHQFRDLYTEFDFHWIMRGFHGAFATGVASQQGTLPFQMPGSVPLFGLAWAPIIETRFLELAISLLDFSPWIPLGTFSILHLTTNQYLLQIRWFLSKKNCVLNDADSSWAPGRTFGLQVSVNVYHGALLSVPQWQCISSFVFYFLLLYFTFLRYS